MAVTIARWHGASSSFSWINCGNPRPIRIAGSGGLESLGAHGAPLGTSGAHAFTVDRIRLEPGERLILASDGVIDRPTSSGEAFGTAGVGRAARSVESTSASSTVNAIEAAVVSASPARLEDDAALVVLAPIDVERVQAESEPARDTSPG